MVIYSLRLPMRDERTHGCQWNTEINLLINNKVITGAKLNNSEINTQLQINKRCSSLSHVIPLNSLGEKYAFTLIWQSIFRTWILPYTLPQPLVNFNDWTKTQSQGKSGCSVNMSAYKNINLEDKRPDYLIRIIRINNLGWFG